MNYILELTILYVIGLVACGIGAYHAGRVRGHMLGWKEGREGRRSTVNPIEEPFSWGSE